jgi:hypothetical protein
MSHFRSYFGTPETRYVTYMLPLNNGKKESLTTISSKGLMSNTCGMKKKKNKTLQHEIKQKFRLARSQFLIMMLMKSDFFLFVSK